MKITLQGLFGIKHVLSRELLGVNIETGERKKPDIYDKLPISMIRHLRRVLGAVDDEIKIADPERIEFVTKWKVYGEKKDELPKFGENPDFDKEYAAMFLEREFILPFSPFKLEMLDSWDKEVDGDLYGLMEEMNAEFKRQTTEPPATADTDKTGAVTPIANAN